MSKLSELIPIPADENMNTGLTPARQQTMLSLLGKPRQRMTVDCSPVTNKELRRLIVRRSVGPFVVEGLKPAVDAVQQVMKQLRTDKPDVYYSVRTAGMLCCRLVRGSRTNISNHSWGSAVDFYFGDWIDRTGDNMTQRGLLEMYPYFHKQGFFWGSEFSKEDSMHWEAADETIRRWRREGKI
jgi:hypothetical protein